MREIEMAVSRMNVCLVERNRGRMGIDRVKNGELCLFVLSMLEKWDCINEKERRKKRVLIGGYQ